MFWLYKKNIFKFSLKKETAKSLHLWQYLIMEFINKYLAVVVQSQQLGNYCTSQHPQLALGGTGVYLQQMIMS